MRAIGAAADTLDGGAGRIGTALGGITDDAAKAEAAVRAVGTAADTLTAGGGPGQVEEALRGVEAAAKDAANAVREVGTASEEMQAPASEGGEPARPRAAREPEPAPSEPARPRRLPRDERDDVVRRTRQVLGGGNGTGVRQAGEEALQTLAGPMGVTVGAGAAVAAVEFWAGAVLGTVGGVAGATKTAMDY